MGALEKQIGGNHYCNIPLEYQPLVIGQKLLLKPWEFNVLKRIIRHRVKGGAEDLRKAIHEIEIGIELEYGVGIELTPPVTTSQS